jgi:hypothetical protein
MKNSRNIIALSWSLVNVVTTAQSPSPCDMALGRDHSTIDLPSSTPGAVKVAARIKARRPA